MGNLHNGSSGKGTLALNQCGKFSSAMEFDIVYPFEVRDMICGILGSYHINGMNSSY